MQLASKVLPNDDRQKQPSDFGPFLRLLRYVWPQKRYLYPAVGCIILMAITYSISLSAILPVLSVLIQPLGLHGWVDKTIAEDRLDAQFSVHNPLTDGEIENVPTGAVKILDLKPSSPLLSAAGDLKINQLRGAYVLAVDQVSGKALDTLHAMAEPSETLSVVCYLPTDGRKATLMVKPEPAALKFQAIRTAIGWIPGGLAPQERWRTLQVVLALLFVLVLVGNVAKFFAEYLTCLVNCRAIMELRRQMYDHVLKLPLSHFSRNTADTMSRFVQDSNDLFRGLSNFFEKVITEPFKAVGALAVALMVNWRLTVVVMLLTPLAVYLIRVLGKQVRRANRKLLASYGDMLGALESTLTGMRVVKGYTRENYERRRLFQIDRRVLKHQLKMGRIEAMTSPYLEILAFLGVMGAILYFGHGILARGVEEETPKFITMIVCLVAIFDPVRKLSSVYPKIQRANAAADRVFETIDSPTEYDQDEGKPLLAPLRDSITFENLVYIYPGTTRPALNGVNLTVRKGETVALVGPNGSGKTTLVSLLPRFFDITSGRILIDGQDITQVNLRSLRRQFSLITQESIIFPDTVAANIAYGKPDATREQIIEAARKAFADDFIQNLPEKYDTVVGEHGATLSGGQRQRIAIARAILRNAPILIFDEATGQVDSESEMKIMEAIEAFLEERTAFVIAHRYSTVSNADRIVVMDDARIVAVGSHLQLLETCPLYRRLYETQFRSTDTNGEMPGAAGRPAEDGTETGAVRLAME